MAKPVTREEKENSKKEFDELNLLINNEFKGLKGWLLKTAQPKLTNLQKLLTGNLKDLDTKWECETEIRIAKTLTKNGQTKIDYIELLVGKLNEQVLRAPIKIRRQQRGFRQVDNLSHEDTSKLQGTNRGKEVKT